MEVAAKGKAKRRHLNAAECDELGRRAEGAGALTQPQTVNQEQGNHDPNRWLYPKSSTKRQKCAPASALGLNQEFFPKGDPNDVDDDSLLAAEMAPDPEEEDDILLLAAATQLEAKERLYDTIDYLEGVTPELFGEDEFEVEALPDTHYGLLGSSRVLLQPQGCMDDLPEEVLRQVLWLLPAQDLYCNVSLVCHRWRSIVQDTKFVPYKKQYYCFMKREKEAVLEVFSILKSSGIMHPSSSQNRIQHLVALMAQHKVGERVRPDDVLECIRNHHLFPQAEASIRLRIPNIPKCIKGPNPYAAMAVILILSESVLDVQALVSLLSGCMLYTTITEYLSHMAMMLLAIRRRNIQISDRVYYNIYYVLHLMENGPFSVGSESGWSQIQLTREQQQILSHDIQPDQVVKIMAFAGTGKTTTLVKYAEQRPHLRFLYVAFNKSVATEAQRRFPHNVHCKTVHSLAFKDIGRRYQSLGKLTSNLKPFTVESVQPKGRGGFTKAKVVVTTLNTFMASADQTITAKHIPDSYVTKTGFRVCIAEEEKTLYVQDARSIWNKMKELVKPKEEAHFMIHDGYLKLWQLQEPKPRLSDQYDVIFIDEAQDCTPAIMDVLLSQRCGKILVGDPHQQIYTFKGAVNALYIVDHTHIFYLTQSFRFGAEIAFVGATILKVCKGVKKILVGGKQKGNVCGESGDKVAAAVSTGVNPHRGKTAILSRCNASVFSKAVELTDANPHCRIHFIGGVSSIGLNRILDIWQLMKWSQPETRGTAHQQRSIKDPLIRMFAKKKDENQNVFLALKQYVKQTEDCELDGKVSTVEKYNSRIPELVKRLDTCFECSLYNADFILGTVHKAKGLEFDTVMVTDDFAKVPAARHELRYHHSFSFDKFPDDEWNLLYVAVTRAKTLLIITENIHHILTMAGEYFLKSEMPSAPMKAGELPCSIVNCPNCITPDSSFIMSMKRMKYSDGVSEGGPLCERCVWTRIGPTAFLLTDNVLSMAEIPDRFDHPVQDNPFHHDVMLLALF